MKKITLILVLSLLYGLIFAQEDTTKKDVLLFEKAFVLQDLVSFRLPVLNETINSNETDEQKKEFASNIKHVILREAADYYVMLINEHPESELVYRAYYNLGHVELEMNYKKEAVSIFKEILESDADDKEEGAFGNGIMADPYANYKNRSAKILAQIHIEESDYSTAIKYLDLTKKYPYNHFCGNESAADEIHVSYLYAQAYIGLDSNEKALEHLIPHIIENGLADNSELVDLAFDLLVEKYGIKKLRKKFSKAYSNYQVETIEFDDDKEHYRYYITFLDSKHWLNFWRVMIPERIQKGKEVEAIVKKTRLYKLLNE